MRHDDSERGLTRGFSPSMTGCFSRIRRRRNPCHPQFLSAENHILKKLKIADLATLQTRSILYLGIGLQAGIVGYLCMAICGQLRVVFLGQQCGTGFLWKVKLSASFSPSRHICATQIDDGNRWWFWLFHNWFGCALQCIFQDVKANTKISLLTL